LCFLHFGWGRKAPAKTGVRYQKAIMAFIAYRAKRQGVNEKLIREIINDAGESIFFSVDE
jgi:hypothetical protein